MIVKATWEFDVDTSDLDPGFIDIPGFAKDATMRELAYLLENKEIAAEDFEYRVNAPERGLMLGCNDFMRVGDLKKILNNLSNDMLIVIPVVDEDDVNMIYGFRKVRTAGILTSEYEAEDEREVFCLNGTMDGQDLADQVDFSGRDVDVTTVLYGESVHRALTMCDTDDSLLNCYQENENKEKTDEENSYTV